MSEKTVAVRLVAQVGQYISGMGRATAATGGFQAAAGGAAGGVGSLASRVGRFTPALLGAGGLLYGLKQVGDAAIGWESAFAGVEKTVDGTEAQLSALSDGLRDMSREIPVAAEDLAAIAESAGQLGIQTDNVEEFTRVIAELGATTNLAGQEGATTLARFANITQMAQGDFDRLTSVLVRLGNNLETTEAEIAEMGLRIAGAGHQIGLTEAEILALAGALSSVGIRAEAGGTAISRVMIDIAQEVANTGDNLEGFARVAGMTADEFSQAWRDEPADALLSFIEGMNRVAEEGGNVFQILEELDLDDIRVRDTLLRSAAASDTLREALELAAEEWETNTARTEEFAKRAATTESAIKDLGNEAADLARTLGGVVKPGIDLAAKAFAGLLGGINDVLDTTGEFATRGGKDMETHLRDMQNAGIGAGSGLAGAADAMDEVGNATADAAGASFEYLDTMRQVSGTGPIAGNALANVADGLHDVAEEGHDAAEGLDDYLDSLHGMLDPSLALIEATFAYEDALRASNEAIAEHGPLSNEAAEANRTLFDALLSVYEASLRAGGSIDEAERTVMAMAQAAGFSQDQLDGLAHLFDHARERGEEFDGEYRADVEVRVEGFQYLDGLDARLAQLTGQTHTVRVTTAGGSIPRGLVEGRAGGGPVLPFRSYRVGELGPETLHMGPSGGYVEPIRGSRQVQSPLEVQMRGGDGTSIGRQMLVQDGAIQITARDDQQAARETAYQLQMVALQLGG